MSPIWRDRFDAVIGALLVCGTVAAGSYSAYCFGRALGWLG